MTEPAELPMFPLGSTVFPGQIVPLHVFEERYRTLMADLAEEGEDARFGTALIERGLEVGGGDQRVHVGCALRVLRAETFDDGRWAVVAAGVERIEVHEWLEERPYPMALVVPRERIDDGGGSLGDLEDRLFEAFDLLSAAAGDDAPERVPLSEDAVTRLDQISALAPISTFDRQTVLEATSTSDQIDRLGAALADKVELLRLEHGPR